MQIFVKFNGKTFTINFDKDKENLNDLKKKIEKKTKMPSENQRLIFQGKELRNNLMKNIKKESTLQLLYSQNPIKSIGKTISSEKHTNKIKYKFNELLPYISSNEISIFMIGSKISFLDRDLNESMSVKRKYKKFHDIFRQQLPLPILLKAIERNQNIKIFLIDPEFIHKPKIIQNISQLKKLKLSKATNVKKENNLSFYEPISLHTLKNEIFISSKYDYLVDEFMTKHKKLIQYPFIDLKFIVVKEMINNESIPSFIKYLENMNNLYYIYEATLRISRNAIHSNDKENFIKKLIQWHNK